VTEDQRELRAAGRYEWEQIIRRARTGSLIAGSTRLGKDGRPTKGGMTELTFTAIALCWASYANDRGQEIWAGDATIAVDLGTTIKNVVTVRKKLLELGLLQHVRGRHGERGEEYRLTLPSDLLDVLNVPTPAQHKLAARRLRDAARGKPAGSAGPPAPEPVGGPADHAQAVDNSAVGGPPDHPDEVCAPEAGGSAGPAENSSGWSGGPAPGGPADPLTDHDRTRTTTDHPDTDLRTAVTASRASPPPEDQISSDVDAPGPCAEHPTQRAGPRPDGRLACVFCRALAPDRRTPGRPSLRVITGGAA